MIKSLSSKIGEAFEEFGRYIKSKLKEFFTFNFNFGDDRTSFRLSESYR